MRRDGFVRPREQRGLERQAAPRLSALRVQVREPVEPQPGEMLEVGGCRWMARRKSGAEAGEQALDDRITDVDPG